MNRIHKQKEKDKIIEKLEEFGLNRSDLESIETHRLRKTLHVIKKEMEEITNKNTKIVIINTKDNDEDSDCSYCDTDDSECSYCDISIDDYTEGEDDIIEYLTDDELSE